MSLKSKILSCVCAWVFCIWFCSDIPFASAADLTTLPALDSTYVDRIIAKDVNGNDIALDFNLVTTSTCTWWNPWSSVDEVPAFYLVGTSSSVQVGLYHCFASVIRASIWNGTSWTTTTSALSSDYGGTGYNILASQEASGLSVISANTLPVRSLVAAYSFTYFGYTTLASNTVLLDANYTVPVSDTWVWHNGINFELQGWEDGASWLPLSPKPTQNLTTGKNLFNFYAGSTSFPVELALIVSPRPDPISYDVELYQGSMLLDSGTFTGVNLTTTAGYLSYSSVSDSYIVHATTTGDYSIKYLVAGATIAIYSFTIDDSLAFGSGTNATYICNTLDNSILPLSAFCKLMIPEPDYLANSFRSTVNLFFTKFSFFGQVYELFSSGLTLFSSVPPQPDDIVFTWSSHSYTFLDFDPISDYADDLRNYTGLIMWTITIITVMQVLNAAFTPSKEDDLV